MTKKDEDPFAKTELGKPVSAAFVRPGKTIVAEPAEEALQESTAFAVPVLEALSDQTAYAMPLPAALMETGLVAAPTPPVRPRNTVLEAPSDEAFAAWQPSEQIQPEEMKGFTELGGPGGMLPGWTELGPQRPGLTLPGGVPPADAFAPRVHDPMGSTQPSPAGWAAAEAASAAAADREIARAAALHDQGVHAGKAGHFAHADALLRESLDIRRRYRPSGDVAIANGCTSLGTLYYFSRRPDLAEPLYREAWALHRQGLGDLHPETATRAVELARALIMLGRVPEAYGFLRGAHEVYARTFGPMHPATLEAVELMRHLHG